MDSIILEKFRRFGAPPSRSPRSAQAGESDSLKGDIQSVLDTWAGHAEEVVASNRG